MGSSFDIANRITTVLLFVIITLTFSGGMPILYLISAVFFLITYWMDKYLLVSFYRKPANYSINIFESTIAWFKWGILIHFIVAYNMFSMKEIMKNDPFWKNKKDITETHSSDLFLTFMIISFSILICWVYCLKYVKKFCENLTKDIENDIKKNDK